MIDGVSPLNSHKRSIKFLKNEIKESLGTTSWRYEPQLQTEKEWEIFVEHGF